MKNYTIRLAEIDDMLTVTHLDNEAFGPYGTSEDLETFQARVQTFPQVLLY